MRHNPTVMMIAVLSCDTPVGETVAFLPVGTPPCRGRRLQTTRHVRSHHDALDYIKRARARLNGAEIARQ